MCYGAKPVLRDDGGIDWVPNADFNRLFLEGRIVTASDGFHYAKDDVGAFIWIDKRIEAVPMRWDLVPRNFLQLEKPPLAEVIRKKNSRRKDPATGKTAGFSSYNARVETLARLPSFRLPWAEGLRMATPVAAFKERPNMEGAPPEFQGGKREFEVHVDGRCYLGGIWDTWQGNGERLDSCSIITMDSAGHKVRSIWHERLPLVLEESQLEAWLDPLTTPARALRMVRQFPPDRVEIRETEKAQKPKESG